MFYDETELELNPGDPCMYCTDGVDRRGREPRKCLKCHGAGHVLTEDEKVKLSLERLLNIPGADESVRDSVERSTVLFDEAVVRSSESAADLEARFFAERGIEARPGLKDSQRLPHEGGKKSKQVRELEELLAIDQERHEKYGDDYRIWRMIEGW